MKRPTSRWIVLALVAVGVPFLPACSDLSSPTRPENGVVRLDAKAFRFSPDDVLLRPGEVAVFEITSRDEDHDFTIDGMDLDGVIPAGETISVRIAASSAARTYTFYCAVPGHREQGMEGVITVRASRPTSTGSSATGGGRY